ncbi:MAG: SoxR reducing system RseC family protein [Methylococcales bacterium]|nr:SoxR reducing system RseC family protein [Methylococcales bacterium]
MIEEQAVVTRIADGQVWIRSLHAGGCGGCMQKAACVTATMAKLLPKREFSVDCDMTLQAGDQVVVAIDDAHLLSTSLLLYMAPILAMLTAVGIASQSMPAAVAESWLPVIALVSLLTVFWLIHRFQALFLLHFCFKPQIIRRASPADA